MESLQPECSLRIQCLQLDKDMDSGNQTAVCRNWKNEGTELTNTLTDATDKCTWVHDCQCVADEYRMENPQINKLKIPET